MNYLQCTRVLLLFFEMCLKSLRNIFPWKSGKSLAQLCASQPEMSDPLTSTTLPETGQKFYDLV